MLNFLPAPVLGLLNSIILCINILFWCSLLFLFTLIKLILPFKATRLVLDPILLWLAEGWISGNKFWMWLTHKTEWTVEGFDGLNKEGWYIVLANHQSWVDIFVLQALTNRRIPLLKFFLKQELIKVPVMGQAWWALDFPFMKRYSREYLEKHPEKRGQDLETTRKACEKFSLIPTSVMNFVEGTRFTQAKHDQQQSPYQHLLKPKAGGLGFVIGALGHRFNCLIDITIVYPDGVPTFWDFLCGRMPRIHVTAEQREIPDSFADSNYDGDADFRQTFQKWLGTIWAAKDAHIASVMKKEQRSLAD